MQPSASLAGSARQGDAAVDNSTPIPRRTDPVKLLDAAIRAPAQIGRRLPVTRDATDLPADDPVSRAPYTP